MEKQEGFIRIFRSEISYWRGKRTLIQ
jgi:hypothetical protein